MLPRVPDTARVPTTAVCNPHGVCLLRPIRTERAALSATPFASLGKLLSRHRAITRVTVAALCFTVIAAFSQQPAAQAGPVATPVTPESLLPQSVGIAVDTQAPITISFETPMNPASVESAFELLPAQPVRLAWNEAHTALTVAPHGRWRTDERYLVVVGSESATSLGSKLRTAQRFAFTTADGTGRHRLPGPPRWGRPGRGEGGGGRQGSLGPEHGHGCGYRRACPGRRGSTARSARVRRANLRPTHPTR